MPETPPAAAVPRSAALVNEEIRALAGRLGLSRAERDRLAELWAEYAKAEAREAAPAA